MMMLSLMGDFVVNDIGIDDDDIFIVADDDKVQRLHCTIVLI